MNMNDVSEITGRQLAAGRALLGIGQAELAAKANISAPTLRRMEASSGHAEGMKNNVASVVTALRAAGITFVDGMYSGAGGQGVRLSTPGAISTDLNEPEIVQHESHLAKGACG
jgi:transcriptional regulator with XRE-family HTH domain